MPLFDMPEAQMRDYLGSGSEPADFDEFWRRSIAEARSFPDDVAVDRIETSLTTVDVDDIRFPGFAGQQIAGWLIRPRAAEGPLPAVVQYVGYGGGRGLPEESLLWASSGFAHFIMDTRGQGSVWSVGSTGDGGPSGPSLPGFATRGIENPEDYYYRRLIVDAVRAVDAVRSLPGIDPGRVSVVGHSQGGGIALAVAGLIPDVAAAAALVPFLSDFPRAVTVTDQHPYGEVAAYIRAHRVDPEAVLATLSYVDGVNFARRALAPLFMSAAAMDVTCPPSTVFAAFNTYAGADKRMQFWPFNGHEGGGTLDWRLAIDHVRTQVSTPRDE